MKFVTLIFLIMSFERIWASDLEISLASGDFYPMSGEKLPEGGLATAIVTRAFAAVGYTAKISYMPWLRGYKDTLHHRYTATFPYTRTADRERDFLFSNPLYSYRIAVFVKAQSKIKFDTLDDLKGLRLAIPLGYAMFYLAPMVERKEISIVRTKDMAAAFRMLEYNRSDMVILMDAIGWAQIEKIYGNRRGFRTLDKPLAFGSDHFIVSKALPQGRELIARFNAGLNGLKKSGELNRMLARTTAGYYRDPSAGP